MKIAPYHHAILLESRPEELESFLYSRDSFSSRPMKRLVRCIRCEDLNVRIIKILLHIAHAYDKIRAFQESKKRIKSPKQSSSFITHSGHQGEPLFAFPHIPPINNILLIKTKQNLRVSSISPKQ